jgi:hypothetical protein
MSTRHEREHHTPHEATQSGSDPLTETIASRRILASALGAFGLAAFAGCTRQSEAEDSEDVGLLEEAVIGTASDVRYADSAAELTQCLWDSLPARRTPRDLRSRRWRGRDLLLEHPT